MTIVVWILSVQLWSGPAPAMKLIYNKKFSEYESCMQEQQKWSDTKFVALCSPLITDVNPY